MAELIGAGIAQWFITFLLMKVLAKWDEGTPGILTANALALFIATVVGGFGRADGGDPQFAHSFTISVIPQLVILSITLWKWYKAENARAMAAVVGANAAGLTLPAVSSPQAASVAEKPWWKRFLLLIMALAVIAVAGVVGRSVGKAAFGFANGPTFKTQEQREATLDQALLRSRDELKKSIPNKLDAITTLVDVRVVGLNMAYVHEISADYEVADIDAMERMVKAKVCASEVTKSMAHGAS
jgi:hypothetical protein